MSTRIPSSFFGKRRSKYGAVKTRVDGYVFDSKVEAARYGELRLRELAKEISDLQIHPRYPLEVNGHRICVYEADFSYLEPRAIPPKVGLGFAISGGITTVRVCEDVKGFATPEYKIKRELFKALYPDAEFRELNTDKKSERALWAARVKATEETI